LTSPRQRPPANLARPFKPPDLLDPLSLDIVRSGVLNSPVI
jgi:hypothetical protein